MCEGTGLCSIREWQKIVKLNNQLVVAREALEKIDKYFPITEEFTVHEMLGYMELSKKFSSEALAKMKEFE